MKKKLLATLISFPLIQSDNKISVASNFFFIILGASSANFLFSNSSDSDKINKTIMRYDDSKLNADGSIDHNTPMSSDDWTGYGHGGVEYTDYTIVAGPNYRSANHYATSYAGIDLEGEPIVSTSTNYKLDKTEFKDVDACPENSRANVYVYIDLAGFLVAPAASYNGSIKIDFSNTDICW